MKAALLHSAPRLTLAVLLTLALLPHASLAQCSTGVANDGENIGIRSFGWSYEDPIEIAYGQSFVMDCTAQLTRIEATLSLPDYIRDGHPPLAQGDLVRCTVYDSNKAPFMSELSVVATADWEQKIAFDFSSHAFQLTPGQYCFMLSSPADKWTYLVMGTEYDDGDATLFMLDTWYEQSGDTMFNIQWDPENGLVGSENVSWDALKGLYR